jgi:transposase InsO family protein
MYGRRKMTRWLRRQGHQVAFCTTDRLMRRLGMNGVVRGRRLRTTIPDKDGVRAGDKLKRDFTAPAPDRVWVADFSYVATWSGWAYVAFVFDAYSRGIVGWTLSASKSAALVVKALNMAIWRREHHGRPIESGPIHHSDAGSRRIQLVVATPTVDMERSWSLSTSVGVFHPSVLRGLLLSVVAMASSSCALRRDRSVPLGKYCRSRPLVFSLVGRCQGLCGSAK